MAKKIKKEINESLESVNPITLITKSEEENLVLTNNFKNINNMETKTQLEQGMVNNTSEAFDFSVIANYTAPRRRSKSKTRDNSLCFRRLYAAIQEEIEGVEIEDTAAEDIDEKKVRIRIEPRNHTSKKCCYVWVEIRTKRNEHKFALYMNDDIFKVLLTYIATGEWLDIDCDPDNGISDFAQKYPNFALSLIKAESEKGKKLTHVEDKSYSKYKYGTIIYNYQNNEELRHFIESVW